MESDNDDFYYNLMVEDRMIESEDIFAGFDMEDYQEEDGFDMNLESENESSDEDDDDNEMLASSHDPAVTSQGLTDSAASDEIAGPATSLWQWQLDPDHVADVVEFDDFSSGWTHPFSTTDTELELFMKMFSPEVRNEVITQTNLYADQSDCRTRRWGNWIELTENELLSFFAVRLLMGINRKPEIKQYWSKDPLFKYPIISQIMKQDRFFEILKNLHFSDNTEVEVGNRLQKIGKIWQLCVENFRSLLVPQKNLSIDESLILYKGRLLFKQYIPSKRSRFGVKTFSIIDEGTGFILYSTIYVGKDADIAADVRKFGYGGAIVMKLLQPYLNKHHHLYCDNFFTSPDLAKHLLDNGTYLCGTLRKNRKNTEPPPAKGHNKMKQGEVIVKSSQGVMTEFWRDKKVVAMISTTHDHSMEPVPQRHGGGQVLKPKTVLDYNKFARGTDFSDMMKKFYSIRRKSVKWYKTIFFHLVDLCIFNAFVVFKSLRPGEKVKYMNFRLNLVRQIIGQIQPPPQPTLQGDRLSGRHFMEYNPATKSRAHGGRVCHVCANSKQLGSGPPQKKIRKETVFCCKQYQVPLCPVPCFEVYHSVKNF